MAIRSSDFDDTSTKERAGSEGPAGPVSGHEQDLWQRFAEASTPKQFCESWLHLQCSLLPGTLSALLLLGTPDTGPFTPAAVFPDVNHDVTHLTSAAERALKERRGVVIRNGAESHPAGSAAYQIAYPLEMSGKLHGVIVLETKDLPPELVQTVMRQLHWGAAWMEVMFRRADAVMTAEAGARLRKVLDAVAGVVEHEKFDPAAMGLVTGLATMLECERVSVGFVERKKARVVALSHNAEFSKQANIVRSIAAAMDEAIDQQSLIIYPERNGGIPLVTQAHKDVAREHEVGVVCTVPFGDHGKPFGALTVELGAGKDLSESDVELIKTVAAVAGPVLEGKRQEERWVAEKAAEQTVAHLKKFVGPGHFAWKLAGACIIIAILFFAFAKGTHRVKAPTVLEGIVQRSVNAPFAGFVLEAPARPGDVLKQGALLCRLDDRELKLERLKWATQRDQFLKQFSEAMAKHDRAQALINEAKVNQAEAQVALLDEQLSRARIAAPFDGIVTNGDFSQSLGTPVERGQALFEVAPLRGYRVIVQVDGRDISWVAVGQKGNLMLPSIPGKAFPFTVTRITPISTAKEGRNYFRIEAELQQVSERLRPGMEGIGKISSGKRRLIWIWTHEVTEWIRLKLWSWWP